MRRFLFKAVKLVSISWILAFCLILLLSHCSTTPKGSGISKSTGSVRKGGLVNGRRFPYKGPNYKYFSPTSYVLFNRAWVHSKVLDISLEAYKNCAKFDAERKYLLMECSEKNGGKMWPHRTHQNGTSIDFGTPLLKNGKPYHFDHHYGIFHYAMKFDSEGKSPLNSKVKIDFETMAKHILELDKAARKRGMYVKKVIFKINLKDDFYRTPSGKKVKAQGIYFARSLPAQIDNLHDDHYHVDFAWL
jgi:penicillin-insensitive murein endopeptidase